MAELAFPWEQIGVEVGDRLGNPRVPYRIQINVRVPGLGILDTAVLEPENLSIYPPPLSGIKSILDIKKLEL